MNEPFVPIEEVAKHFTVSISTVRAWLRQGLIPAGTYVKIGNTYRFNVPQLVAALTNVPKADAEPTPPVEEPTPPVQLEFDFTNPDKDI